MLRLNIPVVIKTREIFHGVFFSRLRGRRFFFFLLLLNARHLVPIIESIIVYSFKVISLKIRCTKEILVV